MSIFSELLSHSHIKWSKKALLNFSSNTKSTLLHFRLYKESSFTLIMLINAQQKNAAKRTKTLILLDIKFFMINLYVHD